MSLKPNIEQFLEFFPKPVFPPDSKNDWLKLSNSPITTVCKKQIPETTEKRYLIYRNIAFVTHWIHYGFLDLIFYNKISYTKSL